MPSSAPPRRICKKCSLRIPSACHCTPSSSRDGHGESSASWSTSETERSSTTSTHSIVSRSSSRNSTSTSSRSTSSSSTRSSSSDSSSSTTSSSSDSLMNSEGFRKPRTRTPQQRCQPHHREVMGRLEGKQNVYKTKPVPRVGTIEWKRKKTREEKEPFHRMEGGHGSSGRNCFPYGSISSLTSLTVSTGSTTDSRVPTARRTRSMDSGNWSALHALSGTMGRRHSATPAVPLEPLVEDRKPSRHSLLSEEMESSSGIRKGIPSTARHMSNSAWTVMSPRRSSTSTTNATTAISASLLTSTLVRGSATVSSVVEAGSMGKGVPPISLPMATERIAMGGMASTVSSFPSASERSSNTSVSLPPDSPSLAVASLPATLISAVTPGQSPSASPVTACMRGAETSAPTSSARSSSMMASSSSFSPLNRFRVWASEHVPFRVYKYADALPLPLTLLTASLLIPPRIREEEMSKLRGFFTSFPVQQLQQTIVGGVSTMMRGQGHTRRRSDALRLGKLVEEEGIVPSCSEKDRLEEGPHGCPPLLLNSSSGGIGMPTCSSTTATMVIPRHQPSPMMQKRITEEKSNAAPPKRQESIDKPLHLSGEEPSTRGVLPSDEQDENECHAQELQETVPALHHPFHSVRCPPHATRRTSWSKLANPAANTSDKGMSSSSVSSEKRIPLEEEEATRFVSFSRSSIQQLQEAHPQDMDDHDDNTLPSDLKELGNVSKRALASTARGDGRRKETPTSSESITSPSTRSSQSSRSSTERRRTSHRSSATSTSRARASVHEMETMDSGRCDAFSVSRAALVESLCPIASPPTPCKDREPSSCETRIPTEECVSLLDPYDGTNLVHLRWLEALWCYHHLAWSSAGAAGIQDAARSSVNVSSSSPSLCASGGSLAWCRAPPVRQNGARIPKEEEIMNEAPTVLPHGLPSSSAASFSMPSPPEDGKEVGWASWHEAAGGTSSAENGNALRAPFAMSPSPSFSSADTWNTACIGRAVLGETAAIPPHLEEEEAPPLVSEHKEEGIPPARLPKELKAAFTVDAPHVEPSISTTDTPGTFSSREGHVEPPSQSMSSRVTPSLSDVQTTGKVGLRSCRGEALVRLPHRTSTCTSQPPTLSPLWTSSSSTAAGEGTGRTAATVTTTACHPVSPHGVYSPTAPCFPSLSSPCIRSPIAGVEPSAMIPSTSSLHAFLSSFPVPPFQRIHSTWCSPIGFQQEDPSTDFRGGGVLGLVVLLLYVIRYPQQWCLDIMEEKASGYFPAATSINITYFLSAQLGLRHAPHFFSHSKHHGQVPSSSLGSLGSESTAKNEGRPRGSRTTHSEKGSKKGSSRCSSAHSGTTTATTTGSSGRSGSGSHHSCMGKPVMMKRKQKEKLTKKKGANIIRSSMARYRLVEYALYGCTSTVGSVRHPNFPSKSTPHTPQKKKEELKKEKRKEAGSSLKWSNLNPHGVKKESEACLPQPHKTSRRSTEMEQSKGGKVEEGMRRGLTHTSIVYHAAPSTVADGNTRKTSSDGMRFSQRKKSLFMEPSPRKKKSKNRETKKKRGKSAVKKVKTTKNQRDAAPLLELSSEDKGLSSMSSSSSVASVHAVPLRSSVNDPARDLNRNCHHNDTEKEAVKKKDRRYSGHSDAQGSSGPQPHDGFPDVQPSSGFPSSRTPAVEDGGMGGCWEGKREEWSNTLLTYGGEDEERWMDAHSTAPHAWPSITTETPLDRLVILHAMYMRRVRIAWQNAPRKNLMEFNTILHGVYDEMDSFWLHNSASAKIPLPTS